MNMEQPRKNPFTFTNISQFGQLTMLGVLMWMQQTYAPKSDIVKHESDHAAQIASNVEAHSAIQKQLVAIQEQLTRIQIEGTAAAAREIIRLAAQQAELDRRLRDIEKSVDRLVPLPRS